MSEQAVFTGIYDEEGKKIKICGLLTESQRRPCRFVSFMMTVHLYQADPNLNQSRMNSRLCVQLSLDINRIYAIIHAKIPKKNIILLFHLADLDNGIRPDIETIKKDRGDIFSECCTKTFKEKFQRYVN